MRTLKNLAMLALCVAASTIMATNVATVDANSIIKASPAIKKIEAKLKDTYQDRQKAIAKRIEKARDALIKLDKNKQTMAESAWKKQHAAKIETLQKAFQARTTLTQAMVKDQHKALDHLFKTLQHEVESYAKKHHLDMVFYKNVAISVMDHNADITAAIQKRFNAKVA